MSPLISQYDVIDFLHPMDPAYSYFQSTQLSSPSHWMKESFLLDVMAEIFVTLPLIIASLSTFHIFLLHRLGE